MPRPKVRPEDRQRAAKACLPCKFSKKRCDAQLPCAHCTRRNNASACTYEDSIYAHRPPGRRTSISTKAQSVASNVLSSSNRSHSSMPDQNPTPQYDIPDSVADQGPNGLLETTSFPQRLTKDRLLLSSKGEQGKLYHQHLRWPRA